MWQNGIFIVIKESLGTSENANYLSSLFERSYLEHKTLKDATRFLVNELFGDFGIVVIDGDDDHYYYDLKKQ